MTSKSLFLSIPVAWGHVHTLPLTYSEKSDLDSGTEIFIWETRSSTTLIVSNNVGFGIERSDADYLPPQPDPDNEIDSDDPKILDDRGFFKACIEGTDTFVAVQVVKLDCDEDCEKMERRERQAELSRNEMCSLQGTLIPRFYGVWEGQYLEDNYRFYLTEYCGPSINVRWPYVPPFDRQRIMDAIVGLHHAGFLYDNDDLMERHWIVSDKDRVVMLSFADTVCGHECPRKGAHFVYGDFQPVHDENFCISLYEAGNELLFWQRCEWYCIGPDAIYTALPSTRDMWDVWDESGRRKAVPPPSCPPPYSMSLPRLLPEFQNRSESYDSHNKQSSDPVTRVPRSRDKSNTNLAPLFPPADVDLDNDSGRSCVPGPSTSKVLSEPRGSASKRLTMNQPYLCRPNVAIQCEASVRRVEFAVVK
ncbi:hypothetical protein FISHEDRAFT_73159 [Fistulina hepatica ATCC 64428]|uniref:Protein kinase domain-containing protein n=1 Tax=Fistulina hepatica ATCC 64428 TaxID=1128425 RepID=A0A0D7AEW7_9AGAR|nr:hypothetical protein FISHEDRAFT_73159 [Fistulina hepatica ATCC 64428]